MHAHMTFNISILGGWGGVGIWAEEEGVGHFDCDKPIEINRDPVTGVK